MRFALIAVGVLAASAPAAFGQTAAPYLATVVDTGGQLWSGKSTNYPATATLKAGDSIWVDHEEDNGWLAVQDPPGKVYSLSWVSVQFVTGFDTSKSTPQNVTVEDDTTLCPGEIGSAKPLTAIRLCKVPKGTILTVLGPKATVDGKSWYPVLPPAGDFRYLPKQMVKPDRTLNTSFTIRDSVGPPTPPTATIPAGSTIPPPPSVPVTATLGPPVVPSSPGASAPAATPPVAATAPPAPPKPVVQHPLWAQAEAAEQDGRLTDAENLYFQLAQAMNQPGGDHDIANLCYTRIHALREKLRAMPKTVTTASGSPRTALIASPPPPLIASPPPPGGITSLPPADTDTSSSSRPLDSGTLVRARVDVDGKFTYALEKSPGLATIFIVAAPGVELTRCLNKRVDVYGTILKHRDLDKPLVVASHVDIIGEK